LRAAKRAFSRGVNGFTAGPERNRANQFVPEVVPGWGVQDAVAALAGVAPDPFVPGLFVAAPFVAEPVEPAPAAAVPFAGQGGGGGATNFSGTCGWGASGMTALSAWAVPARGASSKSKPMNTPVNPWRKDSPRTRSIRVTPMRFQPMPSSAALTR